MANVPDVSYSDQKAFPHGIASMVTLGQAEFESLMDRVRQGDGQAASELLRYYEPEIRRDIRLRLTSAKLRRVVDSMDISQSVFGNFFVRAAHGEFEFEHPNQLLRLLSTMATRQGDRSSPQRKIPSVPAVGRGSGRPPLNQQTCHQPPARLCLDRSYLPNSLPG